MAARSTRPTEAGEFATFEKRRLILLWKVAACRPGNLPSPARGAGDQDGFLFRHGFLIR